VCLPFLLDIARCGPRCDLEPRCTKDRWPREGRDAHAGRPVGRRSRRFPAILYKEQWTSSSTWPTTSARSFRPTRRASRRSADGPIYRSPTMTSDVRPLLPFATALEPSGRGMPRSSGMRGAAKRRAHGRERRPNRLLTDQDLNRLQLSTLQYYLHETNPANGLTRDKTDRTRRRASRRSVWRWHRFRFSSNAA